MISKKMKILINNNSTIREMFEEGAELKAKYGEDKVFDFSIGNPNVPAPKEVGASMLKILANEESVKVHGYMNNAGFEGVRETIAKEINKRFGTDFGYRNIIMTLGAALGLNIMLKSMLNPKDEVIVFAPYFMEYANYVRNYDGKLIVIAPELETFMPNLLDFEKRITERTKAVIINNPNNPTGLVYSEEIIKKLTCIMKEKEKEFGNVIYLISDEPYRELAYDGVSVPYLTKYYDNTLVGYSYSKSLSLPGERIGYIVVPDESDGYEEFVTAATIANRISGAVNAPSFMQLVIERCVDVKCDVDFYDINRQNLYNGLIECGFECIKPQGAFYLWVKSPVEDEKIFVDAGKKYNILMVPGTAFDCPGYVRLAYCVSHETVINSLPKFKKLSKEFDLI